MEPDYIAQNGERRDRYAAAVWFNERIVEARAQGCTHCRFTIHQDHGWLLVEGWHVMPRKNGEICEGEPRWQVTL